MSAREHGSPIQDRLAPHHFRNVERWRVKRVRMCEHYLAWRNRANARAGMQRDGWIEDAPCDQCYQNCQIDGEWPFVLCALNVKLLGGNVGGGEVQSVDAWPPEKLFINLPALADQPRIELQR